MMLMTSLLHSLNSAEYFKNSGKWRMGYRESSQTVLDQQWKSAGPSE